MIFNINTEAQKFTTTNAHKLVVTNEVEGVVNNNAEISMEQAFLKFNLNAHQYLIAGLFTPRIGILNENHLPVNFNGVERPMVETLNIPKLLWGLGLLQKTTGTAFYLHDGRARTIEEAILWHDGEAAKSKQAFAGLTFRERNQLIKFLNSL
jgi:hypothetical protein